MSSTVLVTGGASRAGAHVARALQVRGHKVVVLDDLSSGHHVCVPTDASFVEGCVGDVALVKRTVAAHEITSVVHFPSDEEKSRALLHTASESGVRRFVLSVRASADTQPIMPPAPDGMAWCTLRCFDERTFLDQAVDAALGAGPPVLVHGTDHPTPDGTRVRDYLHIEDLAAAHLAALAAVESGGSPGVIEIGSGRGQSDREIIAMVSAVLRRPVPHILGRRRDHELPRWVADLRGAHAELAWRVKRPSLSLLIQDVVRAHLRRPDVEHPPDLLAIAEEWLCPGDTTDEWDAVDQASWESFPASDPPAYP
jgi:UDP-glucose 4-epimerase